MLCAALGQGPAGLPAAGESPLAATVGQAPFDCAPVDDDGEWSPRHDATASIPESAWKWRTLHAGCAATARPSATVANALTDPLPARASGAPPYLLHIPLLI